MSWAKFTSSTGFISSCFALKEWQGRPTCNELVRRGGIGLVAMAMLTGLVGCSVLTGNNPRSILVGGNSNDPWGYTALLFLNQSSLLVQTVVVVNRSGEDPQVWVTPVAPMSWDSLLVDCNFTEIQVVEVIPFDQTTNQTYDPVLYNGKALREGREVVCGSTVVVEIQDSSGLAQSGIPVSLTVQTTPASPPPLSPGWFSSAHSPGPNSGLILVRPEAPRGTSAELSCSWEDESGHTMTSRWKLNGSSRGFAYLIECPVSRIGGGNLSDPAAPGATVEGYGDVPAGPSLSASDFGCGDTILLQLAETSLGLQLETIRQTDSDISEGGIDLFGNIHEILQNAGLLGHFSNAGLLQSEVPQ